MKGWFPQSSVKEIQLVDDKKQHLGHVVFRFCLYIYGLSTFGAPNDRNGPNFPMVQVVGSDFAIFTEKMR